MSKDVVYGLAACLFFVLDLLDAFTVHANGLLFFVSGVFFTVLWAVAEARVVVPQKTS